MAIALFIVFLTVLVLAHELGHFFVAKKRGIKVEEFGFGFPPRLKGWKIGETIYSINWIPFGGFVRLAGEDTGETIAEADRTRSLVSMPTTTQIAVIGAGVVVNALVAWALFSTSFVIGLPVASTDYTHETLYAPSVAVLGVEEGTPAHQGGFVVGDHVVGVASSNETLHEIDAESVRAFIARHPEEPLTVVLERKGVEHTIHATPDYSIFPDRATLGILLEDVGMLRYAPLRAMAEGGKMAYTLTGELAVGFGRLVARAFRGNADLNDVRGPVGMVEIVGDALPFGAGYLLGMAGLLSLNLAILNLIPFPALDGGRILFILLEKIRRKPFRKGMITALNQASFFLLIAAMLVITFNDVLHIFR